MSWNDKQFFLGMAIFIVGLPALIWLSGKFLRWKANLEREARREGQEEGRPKNDTNVNAKLNTKPYAKHAEIRIKRLKTNRPPRRWWRLSCGGVTIFDMPALAGVHEKLSRATPAIGKYIHRFSTTLDTFAPQP